MAKRKKPKQRPFQPNVLEEHADPVLRPRMGPGETLWRYTVTIPLEEITPTKRQKATREDIENLEEMFRKHFGGFTRLANAFGHGLRDPEKSEEPPEMNVNAYLVVLVSPVPQSEAYFRALREELEDALDEGVILIERQQVWIP
jgi:hypothetical protein